MGLNSSAESGELAKVEAVVGAIDFDQKVQDVLGSDTRTDFRQQMAWNLRLEHLYPNQHVVCATVKDPFEHDDRLWDQDGNYQMHVLGVAPDRESANLLRTKICTNVAVQNLMKSLEGKPYYSGVETRYIPGPLIFDDDEEVDVAA